MRRKLHGYSILLRTPPNGTRLKKLKNDQTHKIICNIGTLNAFRGN